MTRRLFLDLDGTLIDPRRRLYELFTELAPENTLSFDEYWQNKRNRMNQREMLRHFLRYPDAKIDSFKRAWMERVEDPERLAKDVPLEGVSEFLAHARQFADFYLVTARQHPERLLAQIRRLGWENSFQDIATTAQRQSKAALVRSRIAYARDDMFVGDTGEDIIAGRELGMRTIAVTSGVLNEAALLEYRPDEIHDSVVRLMDSLAPHRSGTAK